jgi:hypothetical protein
MEGFPIDVGQGRKCRVGRVFEAHRFGQSLLAGLEDSIHPTKCTFLSVLVRKIHSDACEHFHPDIGQRSPGAAPDVVRTNGNGVRTVRLVRTPMSSSGSVRPTSSASSGLVRRRQSGTWRR